MPMFDCPEPSHTSPTSTSCTVIEFLPFTTSVCGPPALKLRQLERPLAVLARLGGPGLARDGGGDLASPGSAQPQSEQSSSCWRTMWSEKMAGSFTSARASGAARAISETMARRKRPVFHGVSLGCGNQTTRMAEGLKDFTTACGKRGRQSYGDAVSSQSLRIRSVLCFNAAFVLELFKLPIVVQPKSIRMSIL